MDMPAFDELNEVVAKALRDAESEINTESDEWKAVVRWLNARKWQIAAQALRGPPEGLEQARGKAAILSELLSIRGQSNQEG